MNRRVFAGGSLVSVTAKTEVEGAYPSGNPAKPIPSESFSTISLASAATETSTGSIPLSRVHNHASTRTTQLCDRPRDDVSLDEVERILIRVSHR
jgi:hypothetical protein